VRGKTFRLCVFATLMLILSYNVFSEESSEDSDLLTPTEFVTYPYEWVKNAVKEHAERVRCAKEKHEQRVRMHELQMKVDDCWYGIRCEYTEEVSETDLGVVRNTIFGEYHNMEKVDAYIILSKMYYFSSDNPYETYFPLQDAYDLVYGSSRIEAICRQMFFRKNWDINICSFR